MALPFLSSALLPYGTRALTIGSVYFVFNNFTATKDAEALRRQTELGAPNGLVLIENAGRFTGQVQIPLSSSTFPQLGVTFATATHWSTTTTFAIRSVGAPEEQRGFKVADVEGEEVS